MVCTQLYTVYFSHLYVVVDVDAPLYRIALGTLVEASVQSYNRMLNGRFFFWITPPHWEIVTASRTMAFGVLYLSRPTAAWPSYASAFPARGHRALVRESLSRCLSS